VGCGGSMPLIPSSATLLYGPASIACCSTRTGSSNPVRSASHLGSIPDT
jgi:hypothetical protein